MENVYRFCSEIRKKRKITQVRAAIDLEVSPETISAFENGRTNNARVLCWYIAHMRGFEIDEFRDILREVNNG